MNQVNLTGRLGDAPIMHDNRGRWISCGARLRFGNQSGRVEIYAKDSAAADLCKLHLGDDVEIVGALSQTKTGIRVAVHRVTLRIAAEKKKPRGVRELHLNRMDLAPWAVAVGCTKIYQQEQSGD
jgi:hypothetical protein